MVAAVFGGVVLLDVPSATIQPSWLTGRSQNPFLLLFLLSLVLIFFFIVVDIFLVVGGGGVGGGGGLERRVVVAIWRAAMLLRACQCQMKSSTSSFHSKENAGATHE